MIFVEDIYGIYSNISLSNFSLTIDEILLHIDFFGGTTDFYF
jgi:hypothetical protein